MDKLKFLYEQFYYHIPVLCRSLVLGKFKMEIYDSEKYEILTFSDVHRASNVWQADLTFIHN